MIGFKLKTRTHTLLPICQCSMNKILGSFIRCVLSKAQKINHLVGRSVKDFQSLKMVFFS